MEISEVREAVIDTPTLAWLDGSHNLDLKDCLFLFELAADVEPDHVVRVCLCYLPD